MITFEGNKNPRINVLEWADILADSFTGQQILNMGLELPVEKFRTYYWGMPVIFAKYSPEVIIFRWCEYCGEKRLDENDCCDACGAWIE